MHRKRLRFSRRERVQRYLSESRREQCFRACHRVRHSGVDVPFDQAIRVIAAVSNGEEIGSAKRFINGEETDLVQGTRQLPAAAMSLAGLDVTCLP